MTTVGDILKYIESFVSEISVPNALWDYKYIANPNLQTVVFNEMHSASVYHNIDLEKFLNVHSDFIIVHYKCMNVIEPAFKNLILRIEIVVVIR